MSLNEVDAYCVLDFVLFVLSLVVIGVVSNVVEFVCFQWFRVRSSNTMERFPLYI